MRKRKMSLVTALLLLVVAAGCIETPSCGIGVDFSPDGKRIAVAETAKDSSSLAVLNVDGSGLRIVARAKEIYLPVWSPDGRHLLYVAETTLCRYDVDSRSTQKLMEEVYAGAVWSADGRQVVTFKRTPTRAMWLDAVSGEVLLVVDLPVEPNTLVPGMTVAVLPHTWGVAFISTTLDVYMVEAGRVYQVSRTGDVSTLWISPDGTSLRWVRVPKEKEHLLVIHEYVIASRTVTGTPTRIDLRQLPRRTGFDLEGASGLLSPSGDKLLVIAGFKKSTPKAVQAYTALFVTDVNRPQFRLLRETEMYEGESPVTAIPRWSPDGTMIAVQVFNPKAQELWLGRADGSGWRVARRSRID